MRPEGLEPPALGSEVRCSVQLSYGRRYRVILASGRWHNKISAVRIQQVFVWISLTFTIR